MNQQLSGLMKFSAASLLVVILTACGGAEERKEKYLEKGKAYFEEKNYDKARIELKNVLQIDPKFAEAYFYMGRLEERNRELPKALANYKKAIELDPQYSDAKIKLSKIYVIAGTDDYIKEARKLLAEVEKEKPGDLEAELIKATIEYKEGSKSEATKLLEAVVNKDKNQTDAIGLLSTIYIVEGDENKAVELLTKGVEDNSDSISLRVTLSRLLAKSNDLVGAEKYLKEAVAIDPDGYTLQVALSSFYMSSDQHDKAEAVLRKSIEQDEDDAQRYLVLVQLLSSVASIREAEVELEKAIKRKPELYELKFAQAKFFNEIGKRDESKAVLEEIISDKSYDKEGVKARNILAGYLLAEGDVTKARAHIDAVLAEYPNNDDALFLTSKIALSETRAIDAISGLRTVLKNDPKNTEASLLLAKAHELNGESALAETELKKSIEANPADPSTHLNYANYIAAKGRIDEAEKVIDKALTYFKDNYEMLEFKLKVEASRKNDSNVLSLLDRMEQVSPSNAEVNLTRAKLYISKKDFTSALPELEKAYTKSSDKYEPLDLIVKTHLILKKPEDARARLNKILSSDANDSVANLLMGKILLIDKNVKEARDRFKLSANANDQFFPAYSSLASTYIAEDQLDEAAKVYLDAISRLRNKVPAQMQLAAVYERQKNYDKAIAVYQGIIEVSPGNKLAANNLASLLLDYGTQNDIAKALELSKGFDKLNQPALTDTLGWAYAKSGENIKAIDLLKPVVEKAPKVAVFRYHLGYALYHSGDKAAAKSHLEIAAQSDQNFPGKDQAKQLLKTI